MMTVADLLKKSSGVPGDTPVIVAVTERDEQDRRVTRFYDASWASGPKEGVEDFHIRVYGPLELARQAEAKEKP